MFVLQSEANFVFNIMHARQPISRLLIVLYRPDYGISVELQDCNPLMLLALIV
jgi:hypothetical protein